MGLAKSVLTEPGEQNGDLTFLYLVYIGILKSIIYYDSDTTVSVLDFPMLVNINIPMNLSHLS